MRESILTERQIKKYGITVRGSDSSGWWSEPYKAIIQPLRYKNKMYLESTRTEIGVNEGDYYLYIGPASHDLTALTSECYLHFEEKKCYIEKCEKVYLRDSTIYIWAILKKCVESE